MSTVANFTPSFCEFYMQFTLNVFFLEALLFFKQTHVLLFIPRAVTRKVSLRRTD
jgi:hypothetical protein